MIWGNSSLSSLTGIYGTAEFGLMKLLGAVSVSVVGGGGACWGSKDWT